jgi:hypothetical protein
LPWVWLSQIILAVADRFCKKTRRSVSTKLIPGRSKFLSPSDIPGSFLLEKKDGGKMTCMASDTDHLIYEA